MAKTFVIISVESQDRNKALALKPILDMALDWIEIKPLTWLVWTSSDAEKWYGRIKPKIDQGERVFIAAVDITTRAGWMPRAFWDFVKKDRS